MTLNLLSSFKGQIPWNAIITLRDNITMRWCFAGKWTNIGRILGGKEHIIVNIAHKRILQAKKKHPGKCYIPTRRDADSQSNADVTISTYSSFLSFPQQCKHQCLPSLQQLSKAMQDHQYCSVSVPGGSLLWQLATLPEKLMSCPRSWRNIPYLNC